MRGLHSTLVWKQSKLIIASVSLGAVADRCSEIEHIWQRSWRMGFYRGGPVFMSALAGIDIALWDLKGKTYKIFQGLVTNIFAARKLNLPIYELLGGKVRDKIKVYAWIGGDRPDDVEAQACVLRLLACRNSADP